MKLEAIKILQDGPDMRLVSILPNDNMFYGYPYGAAMDYKSASIANKFLEKSAESNLIECSLKGCKLLFNQDMHICITGADMNWKLDNVEIRRYKKLEVKKGQILSSGFARNGLRSYIGFSFNVTKIEENSIYFSSEKVIRNIEETAEEKFEINDQLIIQRGLEWNLLTQQSKETLMYFDAIISKDLSRMGVYLKSKPIEFKHEFPTQSVCTFPGVIQLLPNGQLLVLTQDAQTTGGYPRIAYFDKENLCDFNQLGIGHKLKWRLLL